MTTVAEALAGALHHQTAGHLDVAEAVYRQVLAVVPDHPGALFGLGNTLAGLGRWDEAAASYRRVVALRPDFASAYNNLGNVLNDMGKPEQAVAVFQQALAVTPSAPETLYNLANALQATGRPEDAAATYRQALAARPDFAEAYCNLGTVLRETGRLAEAVGCFDKAIALKPDYADAYANLGGALADLDRPEEAIAACTTALTLRPDFPDALNNLGSALVDLERIDEARACFHGALRLSPRHAKAELGLGSVASLLGRTDQAIAHYDAALRVQPDLAEARLNRALALMVKGRLAEAWQDYEARWIGPRRHRPRPFPQPWWQGDDLGGKSLLLWGEQGLGDEIMGCGMLADAARLGGPLVLECESRLVDLFARSFPDVSVVARTTPPDPRALDADLQIPLLSLARHYRTRPADFPSGGYLVPDPVRASHWKSWLDSLGPGLKVGLSWKARIAVKGRPPHFPPLRHLSEILGIPGVVFVSLQYDDIAEDIATMRRDMGVEMHRPPGLDLTGDIDGLAALIAGLDAVVGPATAAVVLAGALGVPGFMNAYYPVYCEMAVCHFDHVPWGPSIKVAKCGLGEDWRPALAQVADGLRGLAANA